MRLTSDKKLTTKTFSKRLISVCASGTLLLAFSAAEAFEFSPSIRLSAAYSDNISLASENEQSDIIGIVAPSIYVTHRSDRIALEADYLWEWLWYDDANTTSDFSHGDADLVLSLVPERFLLESHASINQVAVDPNRAIPRTSLALTSNRTDLVVLETSPHWIQPIGRMLLDSRVTFGRYDYDDPMLVGTDFMYASTRLRGPEQNRINWAINHDYGRFDYEGSPIVAKNQTASVELSYTFNEFAVFGVIGKESSYLDVQDASLEDTIWRTGLRRRTARSQFEAFYGERSFGRTWGANYSHEINNGLVSINYSEEPSRTEDVYRQSRPRPGRLPDLTPLDDLILEPAPELLPDIDQPGTGVRFVRKLFNTEVTKDFGRNHFGWIVFLERRKDGILLDNGLQLSDSEQIGTRFNWRYDIGARTELRLDTSYRNREIETSGGGNDSDDDFINARLGIARGIGRKTEVSAYISHTQKDAKLQASSDYTANEIGVNFVRDFGAASTQTQRRR